VTRWLLAGFLVGALAPRAVAQPASAALGGDHEVLAGDPLPTAADELGMAADATSEVAAMAPAVPGSSIHPSSDAIDLSSLGLEPGAPAYDDKLNVYGFADISVQASHWVRKSSFIAQNARTFAIGNLNLYLAKNLTAKARALAEVRFTFLPNGSLNIAGGVVGSTVDTTALDVTNFSRPSQWGGVVIERAYVEYDVTEHLTIRAGHWLTPYGIWNIDHGTPTVLTPGLPYVIGERFFPEHQTGLDLFGNHHRDGYQLAYHATISNGRGATEAQADQDNKFAFGGRLALTTPWGLKVGGSYYRGRYTGLATTAGATPETYLEAAYAGDAQLDRGALHLQTEVIARDRHYTAGQRAAATAGFVPDGRDFGFYVLAGYRFERLWNVMPCVGYEDYRPADHWLFPGSGVEDAGLNFRPTPNLVFKLQATHTRFDDGTGLFAGESTYYYTAQACWVF
jgi:hypothetical protein